LEPRKSIGLNVTFADPVYMAFDLAVSGGVLDVNVPDQCYISVLKTTSTATSDDFISRSINSIIADYFRLENSTLGQLVDVNQIESDILSIDGVQSISTVNSSTGESVNGLSFMVWNPVYSEQDINIYNQNVQLPYYKFPYYFNDTTILSKIRVTRA